MYWPPLTRLIALAAMTLALLGCGTRGARGAQDDRPAKPEASASTDPHYSPFVVEVEGPVPFHQITFKDVGMSLPADDRALTYETIAESLSQRLSGGAALTVDSHVRFSAAVADPNNHVSCHGKHVYVDMWHSPPSQRWGYSLWSGCGEDDQFAWRELPSGPGHPADVVDPLTDAIASSLEHAVSTGCFQRDC